MTEADSLATIVIPLLVQRPEWLERCITSALNQTVPCAVVVVPSSDTPDSNRCVLSLLCQRHANLEILDTPAECGYACAFNLGIEHAATEHVGFLLADDWLEPRAVELCLRHDADIVSTSNTTYLADGRTVLETCSMTSDAYAAISDLQAKADYLGHFLLYPDRL